MELFQRETNPWGQEILVRASWSLLWVVVIATAAFLVIHLALRRGWIGKPADPGPDVPGLPEKIQKHSLASRLFHWVMAGSMFVLLATGFLPIIGFKFAWVNAHWIAGFVLIGSLVFHILHVFVRRSMMLLWVGPHDLGDLFRGLARAFGADSPPVKAGKYPVENKLFHHAAVVASAGFIVTGIIMMYRIDNPFLARDPYRYTESTWGWIYIVHGISSMALVGLVITHIYFAILPEKRWITRTMFKGWITKQNFVEHHDAERWAVAAQSNPGPAAAAADPPPESKPAAGE